MVSGAASLTLELVWVRQLTLVFGSTTLAVAAVLTAFMSGLAIGSWSGGRLADWLQRRQRSLLVAYAVAEGVIALSALAIPFCVALYPTLNAWLYQRLGAVPFLLLAARFLLSMLLLGLPTSAMGATLPIIARVTIRSSSEIARIGRKVGALYAANTAGAVGGTILAGFWLMPTMGLLRTTRWAAAADGVIAIVVLCCCAIRRRFSNEDPFTVVEESSTSTLPVADDSAQSWREDEPGDDDDSRLRSLDHSRRRLLAAFLLSGAVAMTLEVLLTRTLAMIIGSSTYSFTLVLAVFLLGLALGAVWIGRPLSTRSTDITKTWALVLSSLGASIVWALVVADDLPEAFVALLEGSPVEAGSILVVQAIVAFIAVAPIAVCLGTIVPLAIRAYANSIASVGTDVGQAYSANTIGSIVGSMAGGYLVLPVLGVEHGLRLCALLIVALAALVAWQWPLPRWRRLLVIGLPMLAVAVAAVAWPRWDVRTLASGVFRISVSQRFVRYGEVKRPDVIFYRDGAVTTVIVERHDEHLAMRNNGKVEASSKADMPTQILVGLIPVLLSPVEPKRVALIGYGSGMTVGAIAESPEVEHVDVIELEKAVFQAADEYFGSFSHMPQNNPKIARHLDDGRSFLQARPDRYQVIVSEPSNPWIAGVSSLFTREFYQTAKSRLVEGGVFCQWVQLYELSPRSIKTIYRTFREAFPYVLAFSATDLSADTILVGSLEPIVLDIARLEARLAQQPVSAEVARAGVDSPYDLAGLLFLGPDDITAFSAGADINTDDNGLLEFIAPRDLLASSWGRRFANSSYDEFWPYGHLDGLIVPAAPSTAWTATLTKVLVSHGKRREAATWFERSKPNLSEPQAIALERLLRVTRIRGFDEVELAPSAGGVPIETTSPDAFADDASLSERRSALQRVRKAIAHINAGRFEDAWEELTALPKTAGNAKGQDIKLLYGYALYKTLRFGGAETELTALAEDPAFLARRPEVSYYLGRTKYGMGEFKEGTALLAKFAEEHPQLVE
ncbi:MAG: fused MFS/spermidine synthase [Pseudomonadota bacterium]